MAKKKEVKENGPCNKSTRPKSAKVKLNEKQKECMRRLRNEIKSDPVRYEEAKRKERERYHARKKSGQIKSVKELKPRDQRKVRKVWREKSKKSYDLKKKREEVEQNLQANTPPQSPMLMVNFDQPAIPVQTDKRKDAAKRKRRKNREQLQCKIKQLENELKAAKRKAEKYKKRVTRLKKAKMDTPTKNVFDLTHGEKVSPVVKKRLLLGEVIIKQIKENYSKGNSLSQKKKIVTSVAGKILKKYRFSSFLGNVLSVKMIRRTNNNVAPVEKLKYLQTIRKNVETFLEKDESSRICPGAKDTLTFKKDKRQKRYLNEPLSYLHKLFCLEQPEIKLSYASFCKLRPFWIVHPKATDRDTCLCTVHENMNLLTSKLYHNKVIQQRSPNELCKAMCCDSEQLKEERLARICNICKTKSILQMDCDENETVSFEEWSVKTCTIKIKGEERSCKKTVKETITLSKHEAFLKLQRSLTNYMSHTRKMKHQQKAIRTVKDTIGDNDVVIHMDFSENYSCKYGREIQSAHFGGSKPQISLHTVVIYYKCPTSMKVVAKSFCTVSSCLRHDPSSICAHLKPICEEINLIKPIIEKVHFISDSVVNQYRNKKMFYFFRNDLAKMFKAHSMMWHYSEAGHGKGAPDGVGGCLKRSADNLVAQGHDISSLEKFVQNLKETCKNITIIPVDENDVSIYDRTLPSILETFKGTLKIHQVTWDADKKHTIQARHLSCLICEAKHNCTHYGIGQIHLTPKNCQKQPKTQERNNQRRHQKLLISEVYTDSEMEESCEKTDEECETADGEENNKFHAKDHIPKPSDFVIVKLEARKSVKHYVALIINCDKIRKECSVKFMKRTPGEKFVFPEVDDISCIDWSDIVFVLKQPTLNNRNQYLFDVKLNQLKMFKNLS